MSEIHEINFKDIEGRDKKLSDYPAKAYLIVNVASKCGFTGQYEGLEKLYQELSNDGLEILGFPCNQFGAQEPGSSKDIKEFCSTNYGVSFPMMEKIEVNGASSHPLYSYLKQNAKGILGTEALKWNFTKFLVTSDGSVVKRFAPNAEPASMKNEILSHLN